MKYYTGTRLDKIFEAIDSDDANLYWTNRREWYRKHGYNAIGTPIGKCGLI
jgi:hypothetical protein